MSDKTETRLADQLDARADDWRLNPLAANAFREAAQLARDHATHEAEATCPTCGSAVEVASSDEGTHSFVPTAPESKAREAEL